MPNNLETERGRVLGIGGVFFKSGDRDRLQTWYADNLGIAAGDGGFLVKWRVHDAAETVRLHVWSPVPGSSGHFHAPLMLDDIVDSFDALFANHATRGAQG